MPLTETLRLWAWSGLGYPFEWKNHYIGNLLGPMRADALMQERRSILLKGRIDLPVDLQ